VEYLKKPKASKALNLGIERTTRWEDNGTYYGAAVCARGIAGKFDCKSVLDVGAGRGFVVRHLRNMGFKAHGIEYGTEAVEHSIAECAEGDLTKRLPADDGAYDLTLCLGVLSHLPGDTVKHALKELHRVTSKALWTHILILPHPLQLHHLTVESREWWDPLFAVTGWVPEKAGGLLETLGMHRSHRGWSQVWLRS